MEISMILNIILAVTLFIGGILGTQILLKQVVRKFGLESSPTMSVEQQQKLTIVRYLFIVMRAVLLFIYMYFVFALFSVPVSSIFVGFGTLSVAASLILREVLLDYVSGMIILFEGKLKLGDQIKIDNFTGFVEIIELRTTTVRDEITGAELTLNNRNLSKYVKLKTNNGYVVDITFAKDNYSKLLKLLDEEMKTLDLVEGIEFAPTKFNTDSIEGKLLVRATNPFTEYQQIRKLTFDALLKVEGLQDGL